jgi:hypothetical protein
MCHFALGSGRENMLSDIDAAFVAINLALCLINEKNCVVPRVVQM